MQTRETNQSDSAVGARALVKNYQFRQGSAAETTFPVIVITNPQFVRHIYIIPRTGDAVPSRYTIPGTIDPVAEPGRGFDTRQSASPIEHTYKSDGADEWYGRGEQRSINITRIPVAWIEANWPRLGGLINTLPFYITIADTIAYAKLEAPARPRTIPGVATMDLTLTLRAL